MISISTPSFARLIAALKRQKKTITIVESSCGGLINASLMAQPGASSVYFGGTVAYNTKRSGPLLLNDSELHTTLLDSSNSATKESYIETKKSWTKNTALQYCTQMKTDYAIAEGGATGPTFRPEGLTTGFCCVAVAAQQEDGSIALVDQKVLESSHNDRQANMRDFADHAAEVALQSILKDAGESAVDTDTTATENIENVPPLLLDRATHIRTDAEELQRLQRKAHYVVLHKAKSLFQSVASASEEDLHNRQLMLLQDDELIQLCEKLQSSSSVADFQKVTTFLGLIDGTEPAFAVDLIIDTNDDSLDTNTLVESVLQEMSLPSNQASAAAPVLEDTRTVAPLLDPSTCHNELVLHATALAQWQRRSGYCTLCGSPTTLVDGGTSRKCSNTSCNSQTWPRQDPSIIVAVSNRNNTKLLLGRSKRHPAKMHTALAGFVEAGESMEHAVAREVFEETGIRIDSDSVRYIASQPWPFPQSTMIGFTCQTDETQALNIDRNELVDAVWFDKSEVKLASTVAGPVMQPNVADAALEANPRLTLLIPPKGVLARQLIDTWLVRYGSPLSKEW